MSRTEQRLRGDASREAKNALRPAEGNAAQRENSAVQSHFRFVNKEILRQLGPGSLDSRSPFATLDFVCECSDPRCFGVLSLPISTFDRQTASPGGWAVLDGHGTTGTQARKAA